MTGIVEVLQRELAITEASDSRPLLATVNVAMCTVFLGYDEENKVAFLGHFDFPCNTSVLPSLFKKLRKLSGKGAVYKCSIFGGNKYGWARSPTMRKRIHEAAISVAPKFGLKIQIENEQPYLPLFEKIALKFDSRSGEIGDYPQRTATLGLRALLFNKPVNIVYEPARLRKR